MNIYELKNIFYLFVRNDLWIEVVGVLLTYI